MLKMIELNNYIINLSLNFDDISSTFDMKDLVIYKTQQLIPGDLFETPTHYPYLWQKNNISMLL
jgi:hypothetical protein